MVKNNKALLGHISKLVADSAESIKRSSVEAAEDQLKEIKKLRRDEPKSFKRKGNEIQYKFNVKLQDTLDEVKSHLEANAVDKAKASLSEGTSMLFERQKLILLADKSDFGWKTIEQYTQHELADNEEDGKKIRRAEERAEKAFKSTTSKKPIKGASSPIRPSSSRSSSQELVSGHTRFFQFTVLPFGLSALLLFSTSCLSLWRHIGGPKVFQLPYFSTMGLALVHRCKLLS